MIANLAYANMQLVKEEEKQREHASKDIDYDERDLIGSLFSLAI